MIPVDVLVSFACGGGGGWGLGVGGAPAAGSQPPPAFSDPPPLPSLWWRWRWRGEMLTRHSEAWRGVQSINIACLEDLPTTQPCHRSRFGSNLWSLLISANTAASADGQDGGDGICLLHSGHPDDLIYTTLCIGFSAVPIVRGVRGQRRYALIGKPYASCWMWATPVYTTSQRNTVT